MMSSQAQLIFRTIFPGRQRELDIEKVVELRRNAFVGKYGNALNQSKIEWNQKDDRSIHFVAESDGKVVSCLRLFRFENEKDFEETMLMKSQLGGSEIPGYLLSRAATAQEFAKRSLNLKLRLMSLQYIREKKGAEKYLFGTSLENVHRKKLLQQMGYEFFKYSSPENLLSITGETMIFRLNLEKYLNLAIDILGVEISCLKS